MGNETEMSDWTWRPQGEPPPPTSWRQRLLVDLIGVVGAAAVLIVIGLLFYPALVERLPWTLVPLLGIFVGGWIRERRVRALASDGLYPVHTRTVRADGTTERYRPFTALASPGYIRCRRRSAEQDLELAVMGIDEPEKVSWLTSALITDGPTARMRVRTTDGAFDVRGRPEHLHLLAARAISASSSER